MPWYTTAAREIGEIGLGVRKSRDRRREIGWACDQMAGVRLPGLLACLATATAQLSQMQAQPNQFSNLGTSMLWEAGDVAVFALQAGGAWAVRSSVTQTLLFPTLGSSCCAKLACRPARAST